MKRFAAVCLMFLALFLAGLEFFALLDPVGTKMADDNDPFGPPSPWPSHALFITIILVLAGSSVVLWRGRNHQRPSSLEENAEPASLREKARS